MSKTVYVITSEYLGFPDVEVVTLSEDTMKESFEAYTGYKWEQYLSGDYDEDYEKSDTFYRVYETKLS